MFMMRRLKAVVGRGGTVTVQDRVDYPEGTELRLDVYGPDEDSDNDELDEAQRAALVEAIDKSRAQVAAGRVRPAMDIIRELREYGVRVLVHDPLAELEEAVAEYGIHLAEWKQLKDLDCLVLAVAHREYVEMNVAVLKELFVDAQVTRLGPYV